MSTSRYFVDAKLLYCDYTCTK